MAKFSVYLVAAVITGLVAGTASSAQDQAALTADSCSGYKKADAQLNKVYNLILTEYREQTIFIQKLKIAQRAWVKFRDAQIDAIEAPESPESVGSADTMCRCIALTKLTDQRTRELKQWLDGIEEGDICNSSIKRK
ncbi:MAG: DUF1311 domain-containing protein [Deltaproteobacteria bacterium]|nr:DUF1311 domain-containing protein [Deltaproteobacteria bacterium]